MKKYRSIQSHDTIVGAAFVSWLSHCSNIIYIYITFFSSSSMVIILHKKRKQRKYFNVRSAILKKKIAMLHHAAQSRPTPASQGLMVSLCRVWWQHALLHWVTSWGSVCTCVFMCLNGTRGFRNVGLSCMCRDCVCGTKKSQFLKPPFMVDLTHLVPCTAKRKENSCQDKQSDFQLQ